jgi:hypothetical protein
MFNLLGLYIISPVFILRGFMIEYYSINELLFSNYCCPFCNKKVDYNSVIKNFNNDYYCFELYCNFIKIHKNDNSLLYKRNALYYDFKSILEDNRCFEIMFKNDLDDHKFTTTYNFHIDKLKNGYKISKISLISENAQFGYKDDVLFIKNDYRDMKTSLNSSDRYNEYDLCADNLVKALGRLNKLNGFS